MLSQKVSVGDGDLDGVGCQQEGLKQVVRQDFQTLPEFGSREVRSSEEDASQVILWAAGGSVLGTMGAVTRE